MVDWGVLGAYAGGALWNQAPWKNNQDLFVVKDDYSAVFGSHFVKAGMLYSYNKKNEEPANTSQEALHDQRRSAGYTDASGVFHEGDVHGQPDRGPAAGGHRSGTRARSRPTCPSSSAGRTSSSTWPTRSSCRRA